MHDTCANVKNSQIVTGGAEGKDWYVQMCRRIKVLSVCMYVHMHMYVQLRGQKGIIRMCK